MIYYLKNINDLFDINKIRFLKLYLIQVYVNRIQEYIME